MLSRSYYLASSGDEPDAMLMYSIISGSDRFLRKLKRKALFLSIHTSEIMAKQHLKKEKRGTEDLKEEGIEVSGTIIEKFPGGMFSVELEGKKQMVLAHLAGRLRKNRIRILPGDRITLELSPYDLTRGRITYRFR